MAVVATNFSFGERSAVKYAWNDWLDGKVWKLSRGEDYHITTQNFRNSVFVAAAKRGLRVRTSIGEDGRAIHIQAYGDPA